MKKLVYHRHRRCHINHHGENETSQSVVTPGVFDQRLSFLFKRNIKKMPVAMLFSLILSQELRIAHASEVGNATHERNNAIISRVLLDRAMRWRKVTPAAAVVDELTVEMRVRSYGDLQSPVVNICTSQLSIEHAESSNIS